MLGQKETQESFFQQIAEMGQSAVAKTYESIVATDEAAESYSDGGKYLPLSVWEKQGWRELPSKLGHRSCCFANNLG